MASHVPDEVEEPVRARIPADLDTEDQLMLGLTVHQVLVIGSVGVPLLLAWKTLDEQVDPAVLLAVSGVVLACTLGLVLGSRDGLSLDRWVAAALRQHLHARVLRTASDLTPPINDLDEEALPPAGSRRKRVRARKTGRSAPAPLSGVTEEGVLIHPDGQHVAVVACTTIPNMLATHQDDRMLAAGMARWLNSLSGPVQIVVQNRPTDLAAMAVEVAGQAGQLRNGALAGLALDHADMLLDIHSTERPLQRSVLIVCSGGLGNGLDHLQQAIGRVRAGLYERFSFGVNGSRDETTDEAPDHAARRVDGGVRVSPRAAAQALSRAHRTAGELQALGARTQILDGVQVQQVLAGSWTPCLLPSNAGHGSRLYDLDLADRGWWPEESALPDWTEDRDWPGNRDWAEDRDWPDDPGHIPDLAGSDPHAADDRVKATPVEESDDEWWTPARAGSSRPGQSSESTVFPAGWEDDGWEQAPPSHSRPSSKPQRFFNPIHPDDAGAARVSRRASGRARDDEDRSTMRRRLQ